MKMKPAQIYDGTKSNAERKVFRKLEKCRSLGDDAVAFHSLNIPSHVKQRFGEADFVILSPTALIVLEVKGGRVSRNDRGWQFTDRFGHCRSSHRGPFQQAQEALHSIHRDLEENCDFNASKNVAIGYGVITPDCNLPSSEEWAKETLLGTDDFRLFDNWLRQLAEYWQERAHQTHRRQRSLCGDDLKHIARYLRPYFESAPPLNTQLNSVADRVCQFTEEQFEFLDVMEANKRIICSGGAGTGKTFLAAELCRRIPHDKRVLLVCYSRILASFLSNLFRQIPGIVVSSIDALASTVQRAHIDKFNTLIVDEGQDLCNIDSLDSIEQYLDGGWKDGQWYFFHDMNNQAGLLGKYEEEAMEYLQSFSATSIPLQRNCRNTEPIMKRIQHLTHFEVGARGTGIGPEVRTIRYANNQAELLQKELVRLQSENIPRDQVAILSTKYFKASCITSLPQKWLRRVRVIDDFNINSAEPNKIRFSRINDFKGLESQCVILIDLNSVDDNYESLLYVGMSRAKAELTLFLEDI